MSLLSLKSNPIYVLLKKKDRNGKTLEDLNYLLKQESNLDHLKIINDEALEGSFLHYLTQTAQARDDVSWRMVYSLSNAGIDVNIQNRKGNTALHLAYMRGYTEIGFEFIEALIKCGTDLSITNKNNKTANSYMEDIEQLNCMYEAHYPGIWVAVENSDYNLAQRLMNSWVKVTCKKNGLKLLEYYKDKLSTNRHMKDILLNSSQKIDLVHSVYSIDLKRVIQIYDSISNQFESNMADYSYCYSWYKPYCRNIPKFLLEIALDTKQYDLIKFILSTGCDVNFQNSKNGNPFFFYAFDQELENLKSVLLFKSNLSMKNQNGESILFYLLNLYLITESNIYLENFADILFENPLLITHRNQYDLSLIELILSFNESNFIKSQPILKQISSFVLKILSEKNFRLIQEMVYNSYGLVLLNTPIHIKDTETKTLEDLLIEQNLIEFKLFFKKVFDSNFINILTQFYSAIKFSDLKFIQQVFDTEKNYYLLKMRDFSGRSCLHLAVLYQSKDLVKFFLQLDPNLINSVDNLNRTVLHYSYTLKDRRMIEFFLNNNANKWARDCKFLIPEEYNLEEVLNDDWFMVKNFRQNQEIKSIKSIYTFMKCFKYKKIRHLIKQNDLEALKAFNLKLNSYNLSIIDLPVFKLNEFIEDEEHLSLLELAMSFKSYSVFRFLLELYLDLFRFKKNDKKQNLNKKMFETYLNELREKAEDKEMYEIVDILDNTVEDKEIADITLDKFDTDNLYLNYVNNSSKKTSKFLEMNTNPSFNNLKSNSNNLYTDNAKNSKLCSIL